MKPHDPDSRSSLYAGLFREQLFPALDEAATPPAGEARPAEQGAEDGIEPIVLPVEVDGEAKARPERAAQPVGGHDGFIPFEALVIEPVEATPEPPPAWSAPSGDGVPAAQVPGRAHAPSRPAPPAASALPVPVAPSWTSLDAPAAPSYLPVPVAPPRPAHALYPPAHALDPKKSFREVVQMLRRGKWLILFVFLAVLGGIAAYTFLTPPKYEAYAILLVDTQQGQTKAVESPLGGLMDNMMSNRKLSNQALILQQSLVIATRTAERLRQTETLPGTSIPLTILEPQEGAPPSNEVLAERLQNKYVSVEPADKELGADAIWVRAVSNLPGEAALIANTYADEYVRRTQETSRQGLVARRAFLEDQLHKRDAELRAYEEQVRQYMSSQGAIALDQEAQYTVAQLAELGGALDAARVDREMREASLAQIEQELRQIEPRLAERVASTVDQDIEAAQKERAALAQQIDEIYAKNPALRQDPARDPNLVAKNARLSQLEQRIDALSQQYTNQVLAVGGVDPRAKEAGGMGYVANLKRQLAEERIAVSGKVAEIDALQQRLGTYNAKKRSLPNQAIHLAQLERERTSRERMVALLNEKLQETRVAEESELGFAEIIRPATTPLKPQSPRKGMNLALGAVLGLLLGIAAAVGRYKLDNRLHTPDDVRAQGHTVLGTVPDLMPMIRKEFNKQEKIEADGRQVSTALVTLLNPFAPAAEAYRRLLTNLQFSSPDTNLRSVLVTSPEAGVGKSITAINLAVTAAQNGKRTIIVDADLRCPSLHDYLGLTPGTGLRELLFEETLDLNFEGFATSIDNLYAVAVREPVAAPTGLLGSRKMRELVRVLRHSFDLVIFDSPPTLVATDAPLLTRLCDATIVVASAGMTSADGLNQTMSELQTVGGRVAGTVLNRFDPKHLYGNKYAYGYYGYGAAQKAAAAA